MANLARMIILVSHSVLVIPSPCLNDEFGQGAPGAGKGTHSSRLVDRFAFKLVGIGDILRGDSTPEVQQALAKGGEPSSPTPRNVQIADGQCPALLPDDTVMKVATPHLQRLRNSSWILDGLPRNRRQAALLDDLLDNMRTPLNLVVALRVPDEAILERIDNRWIHKPSGRVYNVRSMPAATPWT